MDNKPIFNQLKENFDLYQKDYEGFIKRSERIEARERKESSIDFSEVFNILDSTIK